MSGTSGLCSDANGVAQLVIAHLNGGTALALTTPLKIAFLSTVRTNNNNTATADVEWTTAGSYTATAGGSTGGIAMPTMAAASATTTGATQNSNAAATLTGAPAQTWAGNRIQDSTAVTNKNIWYAPLTGGSKTINSGDSCTISSGSLQTAVG
jgi:uncharacterized RmlC-like cupin family protein